MITCIVLMWLVLRYEPLPAGTRRPDEFGPSSMDAERELPAPRSEIERDVHAWKQGLLEAGIGDGRSLRMQRLRRRIVARRSAAYNPLLRYLTSDAPRVRRAMDDLIYQTYAEANDLRHSPISFRIAARLGRGDEADRQLLSLRCLRDPIGEDFDAQELILRYWRAASDALGRRRPLFLRAKALQWLLRHRRLGRPEAQDDFRTAVAGVAISRRDADELAAAATCVPWGDALLGEMCVSSQPQAILVAARTWCTRFHDPAGLRWLAMCLSTEMPRSVAREATDALRRLTGQRILPPGGFSGPPADAKRMERFRGRWLQWIDQKADALRWDPAKDGFTDSP